ncbi:hypothetical protein E2C01_032658 [Portunus trituberculatus]|uniref:Uncharacterized protein n=1 Tax=Portunus trituberculatus TaxID=210409 RepID=A0A5B7F1A7_PORTR|nr:hypothetical protein [Portunus trituberculatus]
MWGLKTVLVKEQSVLEAHVLFILREGHRHRR